MARIAKSQLKALVLTDTIQPTEEVLAAPNIKVIPIASLIGEAIGRISQETSVSSLFDSIGQSGGGEGGTPPSSPMQTQRPHIVPPSRAVRSGT